MIWRLDIAVSSFSIFQSIFWFACQCTMLHIFVKFGRPLEEDAMTLFRNKLMTLYREAQEPLA